MNERKGIAESLTFSPEDVAAARNVICPGAPDHIIKLILHRCAQLGCDPMAKMIYAVNRPRKEQRNGQWVSIDNWVLQSSIDFFRSIAESSEGYAGQDGPYWCDANGKWVDVWLHGMKPPPKAAKVGILRSSFSQPLYSVALFDEFVATVYDKETRSQKISGLWTKMPALMIAKCAEALGIRRAFPSKLSGIYIAEEMQQADNVQNVTPRAIQAAPAVLNAAPATMTVAQAQVSLPKELTDAANALGLLPRNIDADLRKLEGDVTALTAQYVERVAKKHPPGPTQAQPEPTPSASPADELGAFLDEHAEKLPVRQAVRALAIEFNRPAAKAMFPTREARLAYVVEVTHRPAITSMNDMFDDEIGAVGDALRERIATKGPVKTENTPCSCGVEVGMVHFASCEATV